MYSTTTTATLVLESAVVKHAEGFNVEIPSAKENPFISIPKAKQGTLYIIIFPIIAGIIVLYLLGALIKKLKANRQAKKVEPFDRDYEFCDYITENSEGHDDRTLNPFGGELFVGSTSFVKRHHKNSSVDLISQYRRSLDFLTGSKEQSLADIHKKAESRGSILQLNFNEQPRLKPNSESSSEVVSNESPVSYSVTNTPNITANQINDNSSASNSKTSDTSTTFYSIAEPQKTASAITINNHNKIQQHHTRTPSSLALDEFISTGVLPVLNQTPNNIPSKISSSSVIESHSMFENNDNITYNIPVSSSTIRQAQAVQRSPSPQRQKIYMQSISSRTSSRASSRSPMRNQLSPTRGDNSPSRNGRSPTRTSDNSPSRSSIRSLVNDSTINNSKNPFSNV